MIFKNQSFVFPKSARKSFKKCLLSAQTHSTSVEKKDFLKRGRVIIFQEIPLHIQDDSDEYHTMKDVDELDDEGPASTVPLPPLLALPSKVGL